MLPTRRHVLVSLSLVLGGCCFSPTAAPIAPVAAVIDAPVVCWGSPNMFVTTPPHAVSVAPGASLFGTGAVVCAREGEALRCFGNRAELGMELETEVPAPFTLVPSARSIATGSGHSCALVDGGTVQCWGSNMVGELGRGTAPDPTAVGTIDLSTGEVVLPDVAGLSDPRPAPVSSLASVEEIVAGSSHTCARQTSGAVLCWGSGRHGQLGNGTTEPSPVPVAVSGLATATALAASNAWTCALSADQTVACWGTPDEYPMGERSPDDTTPRAMSDLAGIRAISMRQEGASSSMQVLCAIDGAGHVLCRNGPAPPTPIAGIEHASAISSGVHHSCVLTDGGDVFCFGAAEQGQLGTSEFVTGARQIPEVSNIRSLVSGTFFTCAVR